MSACRPLSDWLAGSVTGAPAHPSHSKAAAQSRAHPNFGFLPGVLDLGLFLKNPVATDRGADTIEIVVRNIRNFPRRGREPERAGAKAGAKERQTVVVALPGLVAAMTGMQPLDRD